MLEYYIKQQGFKGIGKTQSETKFIARLKEKPTVTAEELYEKASFGCTMTKAEIALAMDQVESIVLEMLSKGHGVQLGKLGIFHPSLQATTCDKEQDVTINTIKKVKCLFRPTRFFERFMKNLTLQKIKYIHQTVNK